MWYIIVLAIVFILIFGVYGKKDEKSEPVEEKPQSPHVKNEQPADIKPIQQQTPFVDEPKVKRLRYFCIKDKGYHVSVWPKDMGIGEYVEFTIAGLSHCDHIADYLGEHVGTLEAEPTNPYDANAIRVLAKNGHPVGYVPKDLTEEIRRHTQLPCKCYFYIGNKNGTYYSDAYITL